MNITVADLVHVNFNGIIDIYCRNAVTSTQPHNEILQSPDCSLLALHILKRRYN